MLLFTKKLRLNSIVFIALFIFFALGLYQKLPFAGRDMGFEYGNIAASLVRGEGYANVFGPNGGPTAWMLPLNTVIFAVIFYFLGIKTEAAQNALIFYNALCWALSGLMLVKIAEKTPFRAYKYLIVLFFLLIIYFNPNRSLGDMMDVSLINFLAVSTVYVLYSFLYGKQKPVYFLLLAVVLPLASANLFLAFALIVAFYYLKLLFKHKQQLIDQPVNIAGFPHSRKMLFCLLAGGLSLLTVTAWASRNYQSLQKFIPAKSNLWYEFYQTNIIDDDGILDGQTLLIYHPNSHGLFYDLYYQLGEIGFVNHFKRLSLREITAEHYLDQLANRLIFLFFYNPNQSYSYPADVALFSKAELNRMQQYALIDQDEWVSLHLNEARIRKFLLDLEISQQEAVFQNWLKGRSQYRLAKNSPSLQMRAILSPLLPLVCITLGLLFRKIRDSHLFRFSLLTYIVLLLPYLLISISNRYVYFSQSLQAVFFFFVAAYFLDKLLTMNKLSFRFLKQKVT
jgi:hypothetical protein